MSDAVPPVWPVPLAAAAADAATDDEEDAAAAAYWLEYGAAAAEELAAWLDGLYTGELLDLYTGELDDDLWLRGELLNRPLRPSPRLDEDGFRSCEILYDSSELARTYRMFG